MTHFPDTARRLIAAGHNPIPLEQAADRCFNAVGVHNGEVVRSGLYSSDATTWSMWQEFMRAAKVLRGGEKEVV
jgi:hypothetical protein